MLSRAQARSHHGRGRARAGRRARRPAAGRRDGRAAARKVLDVGCGDGELLRLLAETRGVDGRGIELSREGVNECVAKGWR